MSFKNLCMYNSILSTAGETLAGVSERRLQALISKRGKKSNYATAELDASFKAAQEATVRVIAHRSFVVLQIPPMLKIMALQLPSDVTRVHLRCSTPTDTGPTESC